MNYNTLLILGLIFYLIILDQITKFIFFTFDKVSWWVFSITPVTNTGSAFSLFNSLNYYLELILIITFILILFVIYEFATKKLSTKWIFFYILLVSGAIGNGIDRLFFGYVRDFLAIESLFIINIADIYLTLAAFILLWIVYEDVSFSKKANI